MNMCLGVDKASARRLERQSSIENEPLTLDVQQIAFAREAALYVVNNTSIEEAFRIFTESLQTETRLNNDDYDEEEEEEDDDDDDEEEEDNQSRTQRPRDIVSAPF